MFKRTEGTAPEQRPDGPASTTIVAQGTSFNGVLRVNGSLRVDGDLEGQVVVTQHLVVGTSGVLKADVTAETAAVGGRIRGRVQARGRVVLLRGARLEGDVHAAIFQIEDGAFFQGNCTMGEAAAEAGAVPARGEIRRG
jgi:cytoskeletal protein CcmA (bactofilin family)